MSFADVADEEQHLTVAEFLTRRHRKYCYLTFGKDIIPQVIDDKETIMLAIEEGRMKGVDCFCYKLRIIRCLVCIY